MSVEAGDRGPATAAAARGVRLGEAEHSLYISQGLWHSHSSYSPIRLKKRRGEGMIPCTDMQKKVKAKVRDIAPRAETENAMRD